MRAAVISFSDGKRSRIVFFRRFLSLIFFQSDLVRDKARAVDRDQTRTEA